MLKGQRLYRFLDSLKRERSMPLFQNSVLKKYLKAQDNQAVKTAYRKYTAYFHNPEIQQNIRDANRKKY